MKKVGLILFALGSLIPALAYAHGGHKHVIGTISSVASKTLVVKTSTGNVSVPIANTTRFYHGSGTEQEATAAEARDGMRVVVHLDGEGKAAEVHIPEMETSEKVGVVEGKILSRDIAKNELTIAHGEVKGVMGAMTMGYAVRGQKVASLPKDGIRITAKMHDSNGTHWLTDVRKR